MLPFACLVIEAAPLLKQGVWGEEPQAGASECSQCVLLWLFPACSDTRQ